jgi:hypothetical protein
VLVRGYDGAVVYTFPGFRPVAAVDLPRQRQGEGVSIGAPGRIRLSSEGIHSPVLQVDLPAEVVAAMAGRPASPSPSASPSASAVPAPRAPASPAGHRWLLLVAGGSGAAAVLLALSLFAWRHRSRP